MSLSIMSRDTTPYSTTISGIGVVSFAACIMAGGIATALFNHPAPFVAGALIGLYLMVSLKVVRQWQKVALLRLGRYRGLRGPGVFAIIPVIDTLSAYIDQRVRVTSVSAESTLTRDTVPVFVDAIVFWVVFRYGPSAHRIA